MTLSQTKTVNKLLTKTSLIEQFRKLGIQEGMTLEVHAALSSFGFVVGGSQTIVDALMETVGYDGTLVMPLQDSNNTEPSYWQNPPVERELWNEVRSSIPAFKPDESEFGFMGAIPNNLNRRPGAYRSYHPSCGFVTYGKYGKLIAHTHSLDFPFGEQSPLATMYGLPSYVVLLGVGYDNCTGLHLGECRSNVRPILLQGGAIEENGYRKWVKYLDYDLDSDEFVEIGKEMERKGLVKTGRVGESRSLFFKFAEAVDFCCEYLKEKYGK